MSNQVTITLTREEAEVLVGILDDRRVSKFDEALRMGYEGCTEQQVTAKEESARFYWRMLDKVTDALGARRVRG